MVHYLGSLCAALESIDHTEREDRMTRIRNVTPLLMGLALMFGACEQATETGEMEDAAADTAAAVDAEAQLDSLRIRYMDAWNAGNMDAISGMMTTDYQEIGPEGVMNYEEAIAMMADSANMPPEGAMLSIETHTLEVAESGDVAYGSGISTVTIPGMDGEEMTDSTRWVAGFKRVDGEWKVDRLAFAPEAPETEPMEAPGTM
jgi:ketosteroid isomerase-like protein